MSPGPSIQLFRWCVETARLRTRPRDNQRCGGDDRWLKVHEVCPCRRESYLRLVVVWEPSLFSSWLMCRRSSSCVFFSVVEVASCEGRRMLELAVIDEKDARQSTHFWHLWHMCSVTINGTSVPQYFVEYRRCIYDVYYEKYYIGKWSIYLLSNTSVCYGDTIKNIPSNTLNIIIIKKAAWQLV